MTKIAVRVDGRMVYLESAGSFTVGRDPESTFPVSNPLVSGRHLVGIRHGERWTARDLGGEGGTFLDGHPVAAGESFALKPGLELMLGHPVFGEALSVISVDADADSAAEETELVADQGQAASVAAGLRVGVAKTGGLEVAEAEAVSAVVDVDQSEVDFIFEFDEPDHDTRISIALDPDGQLLRAQPVTHRFIGSPEEAAGLDPDHDVDTPRWRRVEAPVIAVEAPVIAVEAPPALTSAKVVTLGREPDNTMVLQNATVSGHHARLTEVDGGYLVEDLRSTNGSYVDGARVHRQFAEWGSVVSFGNAFLEVTPDGLQPVATPAANQRDGQLASLSVSALTYSVELTGSDRDALGQRKPLLDEVTFSIPDRSLLAVIGPSGAGKSTLLRLITGALKPDSGQVLFNGLDMAVFAKSITGRVGVVPQEDLVHRQLTARQALEYAAALRFSDDSSEQEREAAVDWALRELGLTNNADTKVRNLSGGQRKRVSTAMELLTKPDLLLLDEPTSGLDPNLDREVMELLANLAHGTTESPGGRTVVVITHSTDNLDRADNVLLLAPGGKVAYFGPPEQLQSYFDQQLHRSASWAAIYSHISADPDQAKAEYQASGLAPPAVPPVAQHGRNLTQFWTGRRRLLPQTLTLLSRQARLMVADHSLVLFTIALPIVVGLLTLAVQAGNGFAAAATTKDIVQPRTLLVIVIFGSVLMGMVPSVRQLVSERVIFVHEAGAGVRPAAYLASKILLLAVVCAIQSALLVSVALMVNDHPANGAFGPIWVELFLVALGTSWTCAALGLLLSALVSTAEQVMPLMVLVLMLQLILGGGVLPVIAPGVNQASMTTPGRWGFAAGAASLDFNWVITCRAQILAKAKEDEEINKKTIEATDKANTEAADRARANGLPQPQAEEPDLQNTLVNCATVEDQDPLWQHTSAIWLADLLALAFWFIVYSGGTWYALRRLIR